MGTVPAAFFNLRLNFMRTILGMINSLGFTAAVTAFLTIWAGHVAVRRIEAASERLALPMAAFGIAGMGVLVASALLPGWPQLQAALGVLGITLLWDAFELYRQQKRVRIGHAPANPANPRHAAMLAAANSQTTTLDLLDRDPIGRQVDAEEARRLVCNSRRHP